MIDASNLHSGGGVQVGASMINEMAALSQGGDFAGVLARLDVLVSSEVAANIDPATWKARPRIYPMDSRPGKWSQPPSRERYDAALTVFGPYYRRRLAHREICGFALGLLIYPGREVGLPEPGLKTRLINQIRWMRLRAPDVLVTETEDSARRLRRRLPGMVVEVVPNCVSRVVADRALWGSGAPVHLLPVDGWAFASIGRDYPHKNLGLLPLLGRELERQLGEPVRFAVTLSDEEWARRDKEFRHFCINMGILHQRDLGGLYEACRATVMPSLIEIASATPLESTSLGVPTFVADLPSTRSTFGDAVGYLDPRNPTKAGQELAQVIMSGGLSPLGEAGHAWAAVQPTPRQRARRFLELLVREASSRR